MALTSTEKMGTVMQIIINLPEKINFLQYEEPYGSIAMKYLLQVEGIKADDKVFFIKTLHEHSFYHESEVFEFFKTLVQEVEKNFLLKERVGDLLCFVKGSEDFLVHKAEYSTRHEVLQIAKRLFNSSLKRNVTAETREIVRRVLKTLKVVIDEASRDGIDESFLQMIDMVKEDKILTSKPVVNDIHREANFFLDESPKLLQPIGIYVKGIKKLQAVGCKKLAMEIILKCESKIREECKKKDGQDYPDEEMLIMGYFYAEIGFQKLVPGERVKQMIELLEKKERNEGLQSGCSKVVKMGYTMAEMFGVPKDSSEP